MNIQNFTHEGGFPFDQDKLKRLQDTFSIFNAFGSLVGNDLAIIQGCTVTGNNVSDGYVWIGGELLPFVGGTLGTQVIIDETVTNEQYQTGLIQDVYHVRVARFGTSTTNQYAWANFKRAYPMSSAVFLDEVRMYAGDVANIPWGWKLCDGTNGTANLKGKFIIGLNQADPECNEVGVIGGAHKKTIDVNQLPAHAHSVTVNSAGEHFHVYAGDDALGLNADQTLGGARYGMGVFEYDANSTISTNNRSKYYKTSQEEAHNHTATAGNTGNGQEFDVRPAYYTLAYIQFKGV